jgi:hypothetical protein
MPHPHTIHDVWNDVSLDGQHRLKEWYLHACLHFPGWQSYEVVPTRLLPVWYSHDWTAGSKTDLTSQWRTRSGYFRLILDEINPQSMARVTISDEDEISPHTIVHRYRNSYFVEYKAENVRYYFSRNQLNVLTSIVTGRSQLRDLVELSGIHTDRLWSHITRWFEWQDECFRTMDARAPYVFRALSHSAGRSILEKCSLQPGSPIYREMMSRIRKIESESPLVCRLQLSTELAVAYTTLWKAVPSDLFSRVIELTMTLPIVTFSRGPEFMFENHI